MLDRGLTESDLDGAQSRTAEVEVRSAKGREVGEALSRITESCCREGGGGWGEAGCKVCVHRLTGLQQLLL